MATSQIRQNYHVDCEAAINKQISIELHAHYVYMAMAQHFDRDDVALKGCHKFFKKSAEEEHEHAEKFMTYQNKRGGRVVLQKIDPPEKTSFASALEAMELALSLEKTVNQSLLDLHKIASNNNDPHLTNFLEDEYLDEQVESIKKIAAHVTNLKRCGPGLGEYLYDHESIGE